MPCAQVAQHAAQLRAFATICGPGPGGVSLCAPRPLAGPEPAPPRPCSSTASAYLNRSGCGISVSEPNGVLEGRSVLVGGGVRVVCAQRPKAVAGPGSAAESVL